MKRAWGAIDALISISLAFPRFTQLLRNEPTPEGKFDFPALESPVELRCCRTAKAVTNNEVISAVNMASSPDEQPFCFRCCDGTGCARIGGSDGSTRE